MEQCVGCFASAATGGIFHKTSKCEVCSKMATETDTKKIISFGEHSSKIASNSEKKYIPTKKQKKIRVLVENIKQVICPEDYNPIRQRDILFGEHPTTFLKTIIKQHIRIKLQSYKTQDLNNKIYDPEKFVNYDYVENLLKNSQNCFYCKIPVQLLYQHVREPKQWTLERIDNNFGHNRDNVEIACLSCNLRRRCINYERFLYTKQLVVVKSEPDS